MQTHYLTRYCTFFFQFLSHCVSSMASSWQYYMVLGAPLFDLSTYILKWNSTLKKETFGFLIFQFNRRGILCVFLTCDAITGDEVQNWQFGTSTWKAS